jgi:hypothetical protein
MIETELNPMMSLGNLLLRLREQGLANKQIKLTKQDNGMTKITIYN